MFSFKNHSLVAYISLVLFGALVENIPAQEGNSKPIQLASESLSIPLSVEATWNSEAKTLDVRFKNLTKNTLFFSKLAMANPQIMLYARVDTGVLGVNNYPGLSLSGLGMELRRMKDNRADLLEVPPGGVVATEVNLQNVIDRFKPRVAERTTKKISIKAKIEFTKLLTRPRVYKNMGEALAEKSETEAFFTPWILVEGNK